MTKMSSLWLLWAAFTVLTFAAMFSIPTVPIESLSAGDEWLFTARLVFYPAFILLALIAPWISGTALIFRRWPRIFLGILAFSAVAQCAILGVEAWAHARPPKPIIERWLG